MNDKKVIKSLILILIVILSSTIISASTSIEEVSSDNLSISTNNTEHVRINPDGNVGIGTSNPNSKLTIGDISDFGYGLAVSSNEYGAVIQTNSTSTNPGLWVTETSKGASNTLFRVQNNGDVGVGTTNPNHRLTVKAGDNTGLQLEDKENNGVSPSLYLEAASNSNVRLKNEEGSLFVQTGYSFENNLTINSNGYVGIGTKKTVSPLTIEGSNNKLITIKNSGNDHNIAFRAPGGTSNRSYIGYDNGTKEMYIVNVDEGPLKFYTNGDEKMRVDSTGSVGIGTTNPGRRLEVEGDIEARGDIVLNSSIQFKEQPDIGIDNRGAPREIHQGMAGSDHWRIYGEGSSNNGQLVIQTGDDADEEIVFRQRMGPHGGDYIRNAMVIDANGYVGINTMNPSTRLEVSGTITADSKNFVQSINDTSEAVYTSQESPDARAVIEDSTKITNGKTRVELPNYFYKIVSNKSPELNIQVTPTGEDSMPVRVYDKSRKSFIVEQSVGNDTSFEVDYRVSGVREGYENKTVVRKK